MNLSTATAMSRSTDNRDRAARTLGDPRWPRVLARDASADGQFWYSVRTTGVYCRPSCAARPARPENVGFHASIEAAEAAGFRPCKRCKPRQPALAEQHAAAVTRACRRIERAQDEMPSLAALADEAGLSRYHFHRLFKAVTGLTPRAYAAAHRGDRVRKELARGARVTDAILDAGFGSNSRFYERSDATLGMTPSDFRAGGANARMRFAIGQCSLGSILVAESDRGICAILLGDDPDALARDLQDRFPKAQLIGGDAQFEQRVAQVVGLVEHPALGLDLPLDVRGTAFQQRVWEALREIPPGSTASYADVALRIGAPKAVRAVAQACGANALAIAIPCHRVVRNDGALSGYRWGVERKKALLEREAKAAA
ncbi:MAG: Transcriptional regulator Ada / DNA-O6-methylguanine--protein-cysteine S-methyltransferase [Panacagrimonas sp.]|jgi:AraC family transcriptional regulator of adaptative response/methylated-DNA-[protein]-cysteine methyltransferase|nr:bifunctional DNA-binding transcriptional regulator/O6-methylguanine-DNA methyltransferase Ada [Panacagrimonas sp.]MCC2656327.1 Transcriptional regulator Ada / DNA-O6-methylguanine--protein-cysteine S-methyltransferase [Panacagrimonas sp.]